jgi:hypothetical protein
MSHSEEVPLPSPADARPTVAPAAADRGKARILPRLARRLGISPQHIQRLFASRLGRIDAALRTLRRRLVIASEAAQPRGSARLGEVDPEHATAEAAS